MKKKIIKTISMVLMAASVFAVTTGFKTIEASAAVMKAPIVSLDNGHDNYTVCGTHRGEIYGGWSDSYKVGSYSLGVSWYTTYERKRDVTIYCKDCQRIIGHRTEYQRRTYGLGFIPMEDWYFV